MSVIEANVIIELPDSGDPTQVISELQRIISSMNGTPTHVNVVQIDDPLSISPTGTQ